MNVIRCCDQQFIRPLGAGEKVARAGPCRVGIRHRVEFSKLGCYDPSVRFSCGRGIDRRERARARGTTPASKHEEGSQWRSLGGMHSLIPLLVVAAAVCARPPGMSNLKKNTLLMTSTRSIHALMTLIAADNAYPATTVTLQRIFVTVIHNCFCFCDKYTIGKNNEITVAQTKV